MKHQLFLYYIDLYVQTCDKPNIRRVGTLFFYSATEDVVVPFETYCLPTIIAGLGDEILPELTAHAQLLGANRPYRGASKIVLAFMKDSGAENTIQVTVDGTVKCTERSEVVIVEEGKDNSRRMELTQTRSAPTKGVVLCLENTGDPIVIQDTKTVETVNVNGNILKMNSTDRVHLAQIAEFGLIEGKIIKMGAYHSIMRLGQHCLVRISPEAMTGALLHVRAVELTPGVEGSYIELVNKAETSNEEDQHVGEKESTSDDDATRGDSVEAGAEVGNETDIAASEDSGERAGTDDSTQYADGEGAVSACETLSELSDVDMDVGVADLDAQVAVRTGKSWFYRLSTATNSLDEVSSELG